MSKTAKTLLGLTGGGLVIVALLLWLLASNLDGIVKGIIEDVEGPLHFLVCVCGRNEKVMVRS